MPYVANKHNIAQLTNVHYWDSAGNAWSGNLIGAATPFALLPNPVLAADLVLFGIDSTVLNAGPFCSLVFDVGTAIVGVTAGFWYYSDASGATPVGWALQPVQDNTNNDGAPGIGVPLDTTGIRSVHWVQNPLWIVQNPTIGGVALGVTGLWICLRNFTVPGAATPPTQQNRDIYTITWPYVEIDDDVEGDMPALATIKFRNESDRSTIAPQMWANRVIAGLRGTDRGADFAAYLNFANVQWPANVTAAIYAPGSFAADVITPTGSKVAIATPVGPQIVAGIAINDPLSLEYDGIFHLFLRAKQTAGALGDFQLQVTAQYTTFGAHFFTSKWTAFSYLNDWQILDLGQIAIATRAGTAWTSWLWFEVWADDVNAVGAVTGELYDMILIPVDEWACDATDSGNTLSSRIDNRASAAGNSYLRLDSISEPRQWLAVVQSWATDRLFTYYRRIAPGKPVIRPRRTQRLWVLTTRYPTAGNPEQRSEPYVAESIGVEVQQRYSSMRGAR